MRCPSAGIGHRRGQSEVVEPGAQLHPARPFECHHHPWSAFRTGQQVHINGDGETSRDFCFVANAVQANLLAATTSKPLAVNQVYNVAVGERTTLNQLFELIQRMLRRRNPLLPEQKPVYLDFRPGDVRHYLANIDKARHSLGYGPTHRLEEGLELVDPAVTGAPVASRHSSAFLEPAMFQFPL